MSKTRVFDEATYSYFGKYSRRNLAQYQADRVRNLGWKARVVPKKVKVVAGKQAWWDTVYIVWSTTGQVGGKRRSGGNYAALGRICKGRRSGRYNT